MRERTWLVPVLVSLILGAPDMARGDTLHVAGDTYVSSLDPSANYGTQPSLVIHGTGGGLLKTFVRFDLSPLAGLPAGTAVRKAVLRAWVSSASGTALFHVQAVLGPWDENTLTDNSVPPVTPVVASATLGTAHTLDYVTFDVTSAVQDWVDGSWPNEGFVITPDGPGVRLEMESKESTGTSHPMELEVVMTDLDSGGDITAVDTPLGSGLQGGQSSGGANLSLLATCGAGQILKWTGSAWDCANDVSGGKAAAWSLTGNAGTTPATNFLGTTDYQPLVLKVANLPALRLLPDGPRVVGGHELNSVTGYGGTIAGGGGNTYPNQVTAEFGSVLGGVGNTASGPYSTGGGGWNNTASGDLAVVGGGLGNVASGIASTVAGGWDNRAGGRYSFAAGTAAAVRSPAQTGDADGDEGTFVWRDYSPWQSAYFQSTGPNQFLVRASGGVAINTNVPAPGSSLTVSGPTWLAGNAGVTGNLSFGTAVRQMINLWGTQYGIGVQSYGTYFRSDANFSWFRGGVHNDGIANPGGGQLSMQLDALGNLRVLGTLSGGGADFAEMLAARDGLEPGDVLAIGPDGRLARSTEAYQDSLAGVYSTKPGLLGGAADGDDLTGKIPLAVSGVIPVKVTAENGPIAPGDSLTSSSTPGYAMRASKIHVGKAAFFPSGVILGKALEPLDSGEGVIRALVVLQ